MTAPRAFSLEVPARADYLVMARLFVAAAAEELGSSIRCADDLRLAVSEAAGSLLPGGGAITIHVTGADDDRVAVAVRGAGKPAEPEAPADLSLGLELVRGLLGEVAVTTGDLATEIRFSAPLA